MTTILKTHELMYLRSLCDITHQSVKQGFTLYERFTPLECGIEAYCQYNDTEKKILVLRYPLKNHTPQLFSDALQVAKCFYGDTPHKLFLDNPLVDSFFKYKFIEV